MSTNISNPDGFSQVSADLDDFSQDLTSLDNLAPEHQGYIEAESDRTTPPTQRRQINREQAQQQLAALGYTFSAGDTVYLRGFYHPTDPRKKNDKGRKEEAANLDRLIAHATKFQNEGRGIYFVVNGGGQKNEDVTIGRAIFYEHDDLDKAAQIELWKGLGLPEPSLQIDTGGKSIHSYWIFVTPIAIEKWLPLQADLLEFADADRSIKNASRVMRLAGAYHTSGNQSLIITNSDKRYTFEDLRGIIPEAKKPETKKSKTKQSEAKQPKLQLENTSDKPNSYKEIEVPVPTPVPLECALGKNSKELLDGVSIERNNSMAALARDLLGVEAEFQSLGQTSSDDAYTLFVDACRNCSPGDGWDEKEWNQIWEYAQTQNPTASNSKASPDAVENCIKSWFWQWHKPYSTAVLQRSFDKESTGDNSPAKSKNKRLLNLIGARWGKRLKLNEMTLQIEMDGKEINTDQVYFQMAEEMDIDVPKEKASDLVVTLAKKNTYSPVRDYLDSLKNVAPISLDNLAERYFGTSDPLHQILLKRTLIAAVARTYDPGCKHDTLLILQGGQGFLKSTFLMELAGKIYFTDNLNDGNEKDEKLKLRRYWALEYSEFETAFKRKEVEQLKAFLSSPVDSLRVPYGKSIENFPRTSFFVGSTNRQEFLNDPTGERRYWVIPVSRQIPIQMVKQERDAIWAAAVLAYRNGEQWWLTPEEDKLLAEANKGWQSSDAWETNILNYLESRETCTVGELLEKVIGMDLAQQKKGEQMRVSDILRCNGWTRATKRIDGKLHKCWERVVTGGNGVVTEVVTPQNPCPDSKTDIVLPPVTTFESKKSKNIDLVAKNNDLAAESNGIEKNKSFETIGGNTPVATPETPTAHDLEPVTTSVLPPAQNDISEFVEQVKDAQTLAEVTAVWGDDLEFKAQIKAQLPKDELKRIGKLYKQAHPSRRQPIELPDNSQQPELAEPAPAQTEPESIESSAQLTDTSSEAQPELATLAIGDLVEILQNDETYQRQKGKIADIGYGATETDYYVKLENEKVIVTIPRSANTARYLRKL